MAASLTAEQRLSPAAQTSVRSLGWLNFFLADVQTGVGPFLAAYLGASHWNARSAGFVLTFGSLALASSARDLNEELESALHAEVHHLTSKAAERWDRHRDPRPAALVTVYERMVASASSALEKRAYRRALEFARGADALAHARWEPGDRLEDGSPANLLSLKVGQAEAAS